MRKPNEKWNMGELILSPLYMLKSSIVGDSGLEKDRKNALTYESKDGNLTIDTCHTIDTGFYETGIVDKRYESGEDWIIVEEYATGEDAKIGHNKWIKKMKAKKLPEFLEDVFIGEKYKLNNIE